MNIYTDCVYVTSSGDEYIRCRFDGGDWVLLTADEYLAKIRESSVPPLLHAEPSNWPRPVGNDDLEWIDADGQRVVVRNQRLTISGKPAADNGRSVVFIGADIPDDVSIISV